MAEKAENDKKLRQKEEIIESALKQKKTKEENKKKELEQEEEFKKRYIEKIEKFNAQKRKQKEVELRMDVEKQWQMKLEQYQKQKDDELKNIQNLKKKQQTQKYIIEQEKRRLIKENEDLLKGYYPLGYQKAINSLKTLNENNIQSNDTKHEIIINNIIGNSNSNKTSAYPKYGNIKNFIYDKAIQDVHPKINIKNYLMYNATANNNYDSYPTPEEYMKMMKEVGQTNFSYDGNTDTTGIPMRAQIPIFGNRRLTKSTSYAGNLLNTNTTNTNYFTIQNGRRTLMKSSSTIYSQKMKI